MAGRRNIEIGTTVDTSRLDTSVQSHEDLPELKILLTQLKISEDSSNTMEVNLIHCLKKVLTEVIDQNTELKSQVDQLSQKNE